MEAVLVYGIAETEDGQFVDACLILNRWHVLYSDFWSQAA